MASANITALTALTTPTPTMLLYAGLSPFGVTDDRKITQHDLLSSIEATGGTPGPHIFQTGATGTASLGAFPSLLTLSTDTGSYYALRFTYDNAGTKTVNQFLGNDGTLFIEVWQTDLIENGFFTIGPNGATPSLVTQWFTSTPGGGNLSILVTDTATQINNIANLPLEFLIVNAEQARFSGGGIFRLGVPSTLTGRLTLAVSGDADTQSFQAADTIAATNVFKWPGPDPVGGQVLTAAAPAAGIVVMSWTSPAAGSFAIGGTVTGGTAGSVLFVGAGPVLAQDNANFFWDDGNNRLGLGTATPAKLLHVNGIAQLGTVSATTGQLQLANSASANLTTIQAGNAAAARTYTWPTDFGASGSVLTDAAGNGTLSWAAGGGGGSFSLNGAQVVTNTTQSVNNNSLTTITFNTTVWDTNSFFSGGAPTHITFATSGKYLVVVQIAWNNAGSGVYIAQARLNATGGADEFLARDFRLENSGGSAGVCMSFSFVYDATATDFITIEVFQNSGVAVNLTGAAGIQSPATRVWVTAMFN